MKSPYLLAALLALGLAACSKTETNVPPSSTTKVEVKPAPSDAMKPAESSSSTTTSSTTTTPSTTTSSTTTPSGTTTTTPSGSSTTTTTTETKK